MYGAVALVDDKGMQWMDGYHFVFSRPNIGVALAAQFMKAKAIWNHDAFFDYVERWMSTDEKWD